MPTVMNILKNTDRPSKNHPKPVPFEDHVGIVHNILTNSEAKNTLAVESALGTYVIEMSIRMHQHRLGVTKLFEFFTQDPKHISEAPHRVETARVNNFIAYLQAAFKMTQQEPIPGATELLAHLEEVKRTGSADGQPFLKLSRLIIFKAIHRMLGFLLDTFSKNLNKGKDGAKRVMSRDTLLATTQSYKRLTQCTVHMGPLIKDYMIFTDEEPASLSTGSQSIIDDQDNASDGEDGTVGDDGYDSEDDDPRRSNLLKEVMPDSPFGDHSSSNHWTKPSDTHDNACGWQSPGETKDPSQHQWGYSVYRWLSAVVAQYRAIMFLSKQRTDEPGYDTDLMFGESKAFSNYAAPKATMATWKELHLEETIKNKALLHNIEQIVNNHRQSYSDFQGTIHAELIVAAQLFNSHHGPEFCIGISRRPCYLCYQVLSEMQRMHGRPIHFRPVESSCRTWKVDLPDDLGVDILEKVWKIFKTATAKLLTDNEQRIQEFAANIPSVRSYADYGSGSSAADSKSELDVGGVDEMAQFY